MTVQLSPHKVSKILRGYFHGLPQTEIAKQARVDQSSVSHYASRFKKTAAQYSLLVAGKEYQVLNEVESLRSLSVELYESKLTVEEARQGCEIIRAFLKLEINPEKHLALVGVCKKIEDPGFVDSALKLAQIEAQAGMEYQQVIANFKEVQDQLPKLKEKLTGAKVELKTISDAILKNKQKLANQEAHLKKYQDEVKAKVTQLEKELKSKMKQVEVEKKEIEDVAALKAEFIEKGLDLTTLINLVKEF